MVKTNGIYQRVIIFICLGLYACPALSQVKGRFNEYCQHPRFPFTVTQISNQDGLPQNQVSGILRCRDGALVLNTTNGIVFFNGYGFKPVVNDASYKKQFFRKLAYSAKHNQILGHDEYHQFYVVFPTYRKIEVDNQKVYNFAIKGDSVFILTSNADIYVYNLLTHSCTLFTRHTSHFPALEPSQYSNDAIACDQRLFFATNAGLFCANTQTKKLIRLTTTSVKKLNYNPADKCVYYLATNCLYRYKDSSELVVKLTDKTDLTFYCIEFGPLGVTYIGSNAGLFTISNGKVLTYSRAHGLTSNIIHSLYYDSVQNSLFAGTIEKGLMKLQYKDNFSFSNEQGIAGSSLNSIIKTKKGDILLAENRNRIVKFNEDTVTGYIGQTTFFASLAEIKGRLFAGTWGDGIFVYDGPTLTGRIMTPQLPSDIVHCIYGDSRNIIWAGTSAGLAKGNSTTTMQPFFPKQIAEAVVNIHELKNGQLCIGATACFYIIDDRRIIKKIGLTQGLTGKEVRSFYEDAEGKLWVGTYGGGLFCYHNNRLTSINSQKGCMLDKDVFCLVPDRLGYLYITSNHGLWRVSETALNDFYNKRVNYLVPFLYDNESGILNTEFNGGFQNNFLWTASGQLYFPSIEGLVVTHPGKPGFNKLQPAIDKVTVNDTMEIATKARLKRNTYSIQIDFSCANFSSRQNIHFQHKLTGETNYDWSVPKKSRSVYLKVLPPGRYRFSVRALDGFNDKHPAEASFEFEIEPHIYETTWFGVLTIVCLVALVALIARIRIKQVRRRAEEKEMYNRRVAEIELKAIQAQLNPHFIFNCLNTIKYLILEKDFENANQSLNTFSSLVRNSLENSDKLFVPFSKELKFMRDYVELEKMRLKEQFEYNIIVNPSITEDPSIPHLIIQPYIENAIKHGISNLENEKGRLQVYFEKNSTGLTCTVTDNGIGRTAARRLNEKNKFHVSKGTQLTNEKSAFLKQYNNYHCSIQTVDLYDEKQRPTGTKVIIEIPLL